MSENTELIALISGIAGVILSIALMYIPGLNVKWDELLPDRKRMYVGLLLLLSTAGVIGVSCTNLIVVVTCDKVGILDVLFALVMALTANQSMHRLLPMPKAVKLARENRHTSVAVG
jgi:hypothetical protein